MIMSACCPHQLLECLLLCAYKSLVYKVHTLTHQPAFLPLLVHCWVLVMLVVIQDRCFKLCLMLERAICICRCQHL